MREQLISLATLSLVFSGMVLRSSMKLLAAMAVLWLLGKLFPHVADALGLPQHTVYTFIMSLLDPILSLPRRR